MTTICYFFFLIGAFLMAQVVKNPPAMQETWVGKIWRKAWLSIPVFLPGESHEQRSLMGCSPWSHKESDQTEWLAHTCTQLLYNVVLVSAVEWSESAICIHICPLSLPPIIPSISVTAEHWPELPPLYSRFPVAICVTHGCAHTAIPTHPIPLPHPVSTHPFFTSASLFLPCK